jgi:predicted nucleic acid-binding protein
MNGDKYLADTNAFIYLLEKRPAMLSLVSSEWSYSFITKIELLGKPNITPDEISVLTDLLAACHSIPHSEQINDLAISLKQRYAIKTPDALIAATAIHNNLPLLTADTGFIRIQELDMVLIEL